MIRSAKEAREASDSVNSIVSQALLEDINQLIERAVQKGYTSVSLSSLNSISMPVKKHLESLGYTYSEFYDQRDNYNSKTLSW